MKSKSTALILSVFVGTLGIDRFYLGYTGMGLLKLFTGGLLGLLTIVDIIRIATGSLQPADGSCYSEDAPSPYEIEMKKKLHSEKLLASGGWRCSCGRVNPSYASSCVCTKSRKDVEQEKNTNIKREEVAVEANKVTAIKGYKELLDAGMITQEEFDAKKKQLLGLS